MEVWCMPLRTLTLKTTPLIMLFLPQQLALAYLIRMNYFVVVFNFRDSPGIEKKHQDFWKIIHVS